MAALKGWISIAAVLQPVPPMAEGETARYFVQHFERYCSNWR